MNNLNAALVTLIEQFYDFKNAGDDESANKTKMLYEAEKNSLIAQFPDAHCNDVDPWLFEEFSDWYKDTFNFRPRGKGWTVSVVRDWMDRQALDTSNDLEMIAGLINNNLDLTKPC